MTITLSNLRYIDASNTRIDMDIDGVLPNEIIPFTYDPGDHAPVTEAVRTLLAQGGYTIAAYTPPAPPPGP